MSEFNFDLPPAMADIEYSLTISKAQAVIIFSQATGLSVDHGKALIEQNWELLHALAHVRPISLGRMIRAYYLANKEK